MQSILMNEFTITGFYFSAILFWFAAFLLVALYKYRWRSEGLSLALWLISQAIAGLSAWFITGQTRAILFAMDLIYYVGLSFRSSSILFLQGVFIRKI